MSQLALKQFFARKELTGPGLLDITQKLDPPLVLPTVPNIGLRCGQIEISDLIPNVFNGVPYGLTFDNTRLLVATDVHPWIPIVLPMGLYLEGSMLAAAINSAINTQGWWTNPVDPGFEIEGNGIIERFTIKIDSSKLNPVHGTQFMVDFSAATTMSSFYKLLGVSATTSYLVDGLYTSTVLPIMETQGTASVIEMDIAPIVKYNNTERRIIAIVSFASKYVSGNTVYPQGGINPEPSLYEGSRTINSYSIKVRTRDGQPMLFMGGLIEVKCSFLGYRV